MGIRYTRHAREQMALRRVSEAEVDAVLGGGLGNFQGVSVTGAWVYSRRIRRRRLYVLVEPYSDPPVVISVMLWKPLMRDER